MCKKPKVSVFMTTYNHERFIAQAIESVLEQKTKFDLELVIGEDCSTDGTRKIVAEYARRYPQRIKAMFRETNLGMMANGIQTMKECSGEYIAMLEGDDYWIDPYKLQRQVDFLDAHPLYSLCCHCYKIYDEEKKNWDPDDGNQKLFADTEEGKDITTDIFLNYRIDWLIHPLTVVFRKEMFDIGISAKYKHFSDVPLFYHLIAKGKGRRFNFVGGVYRRHRGGIYSGQSMTAKAELCILAARELYEANKLPAIKKNYMAIYSRFLYIIVISTRKPFFRKRVYYHIYRLFLLSPTYLIAKLIKLGYYSFHVDAAMKRWRQG